VLLALPAQLPLAMAAAAGGVRWVSALWFFVVLFDSGSEVQRLGAANWEPGYTWPESKLPPHAGEQQRKVVQHACVIHGAEAQQRAVRGPMIHGEAQGTRANICALIV